MVRHHVGRVRLMESSTLSKRPRGLSSPFKKGSSIILLIALVFGASFLIVTNPSLSPFRDSALDSFSDSLDSDESDLEHKESANWSQTNAESEKRAHAASVQKRTPSRPLDRRGVQEALTTIREDWKGVINAFLDDAPLQYFSAQKIRYHFHNNIKSVTTHSILVTILNGNVTFTEKYPRNQEGRAPSVKYILRKIVEEKGASLAGVTFMVMIHDGNKPQVATLGSARHWNHWNLMIPVPLGNSRGKAQEWGTPFEGWDAYIDKNIVETHKDYDWDSKIDKAMFRGSLPMQTHKLGTCNEENDNKCRRASKWNEVNRGVLYEIAKPHPNLFDIGFTSLKPKDGLPSSQFDGAPKPVDGMEFRDFQRYKYLLNVGSNQDWAERLRSLLFMNSAVVLHEAETQEFFTPLLKPWVHYIPTDVNFTDLVDNVKWATENDKMAHQITRNQNAFADRYISERSMQIYWEVLLEEFSARQAAAASQGLDTEE